MSSKTHIKLNDGHEIPLIGFGTGTANYGQDCTDHVLSALQVGYRYLDGAQAYGNSASIRNALKKWDGKREDVYVLTKCGVEGAADGENHPRKVLEGLLKEVSFAIGTGLMGKLDVSYVDMYLIHNPLLINPMTLSESWQVMEELKAEGLTRSIGVSNYREEDLLEMEKTWTTPPAVNQIEMHPYVFHAPNMQRLLALQKKHAIAVQAYAPLNPITRHPGGPVDPVVKRIAEAKGVSGSRVLLAWAAQYAQGCVVTTSRNRERQVDQLGGVELTEGEVDEISEAGRQLFSRHFQRKVWDAARP